MTLAYFNKKLRINLKGMSMSLPTIPPKVFSFSAVVVGYILIDDLTANEQNALGNWLMLAAQVLCTNAFYKQVQTDRQIKNQDSPSNEETVVMLRKMIDALNREIEEIKKTI